MSPNPDQRRRAEWQHLLHNHLQELQELPGEPEQRTALLAELNEVRKVLFTLSVAYNARAPVLKLPDELFVYVVDLLRDVWDFEECGDIGWLQITAVCQSWRRIALATPLLWTRVNLFLGFEWAKTFCERAKSMPLSLSATSPAEHSGTAAADTLDELTEHFEGRSWPAIRALDFPRANLGFGVHHFPTALYTRNTLRSLTLHSELLIAGQRNDFWDVLPLRIEKLALVGHDVVNRGWVVGLLPFLSRCAYLKALSIDPGYLENLNLIINGAISLPSLQNLAMAEARSGDCRPFLEAIQDLSSIDKLTLEVAPFEVPDLEALLRTIHRVPHSAMHERLTNIGIGPTSKDQLTVAATRAANPADALDRLFREGNLLRDSKAVRDVNVCLATSHRAKTCEFIYRIVHWLDLSCLHTLLLYDIDLHPDDVIRCFSDARAVEELYLVRPRMSSVLIALGLRTANEEEGREGTISPNRVQDVTQLLFPKLRHLHIERIDFDNPFGVGRVIAQTNFCRTLDARSQLAPDVLCTVVMKKCSMIEVDREIWSTSIEVKLQNCAVNPSATRGRRRRDLARRASAITQVEDLFV